MKWAIKPLIFILLSTQAFGADLVQLYLQKGEEELINAVENELVSRSYWENKLGDKPYKYGYYETKKNILVACKECNNLQIFTYDGGDLTQTYDFGANFGKEKGDKFAEGDLKTPIGVYEFTKKIASEKLLQYYGPAAFVTNYPNNFDKALNKNGYGIWLHGYPLDGNRSELQTKGCIAIENDNLKLVDSSVDYKNAVLIINEKEQAQTNKDEIVSVLQGLFLWRRAWVSGNIDDYISFYSPDFKRLDGVGLEKFKQIKEKIFKSNRFIRLSIQNIEIIPYPNSLNKKIFKVKFLENYRSNIHKFYGMKEIFVHLLDKKFLILVEG